MKKRGIGILMAAVMCASLAACGQTGSGVSGTTASDESSQAAASQEEETGGEADADQAAEGESTLVVYFSWSSSGNTEKMAQFIQQQTGGDILELEPLNPYPEDYEECGEVAQVERDENARPEIANLPDSLDGYETIFVGYPIWWHTAPMIIGTFLESYDLSGVEIYPFSQSASMDTEQFDNSMEFVRENAGNANVHEGLFVDSSDTEGIMAYLTENVLADGNGSGSAAQTDGSNILIAYFSVMETDGVDTVAGASRVAVDGEVMGNNQYIARLIEQETGGDLFSIETVQQYPTTHDPLLEFAYDEKTENARPELAAEIENLEQYDIIFLGYPNWNADLPMPLYTFLEEYDFSGKTIIPFTTHGGSGFSRTISTIEGLQPGAEVLTDGLSISRNSVSGAAQAVRDWVQGLGLADR